MTKHPVSQSYMSKVLPSWERNNYNVSLFEAITPPDLATLDDIAFDSLKKMDRKSNQVVFNRNFTETEKAVWYSHFFLWEKVFTSERPAIIIEHDSKLVRHIPADLNKPKFLSFCNDTWTKRRVASDIDPGDGKGKFLCPGSGYYLTPMIAWRMYETAMQYDIKLQVDGFLRSFIPVKKESDFYFIEQINTNGLNTIDHKKNYRKYVPL